MRIFTNAWFRRFARRENIDNETLKEAVARADRVAQLIENEALTEVTDGNEA